MASTDGIVKEAATKITRGAREDTMRVQKYAATSERRRDRRQIVRSALTQS
jgi:hypothetical protein